MKIKVFQDYSSSGLWIDEPGSNEHGMMIDHEDISHVIPEHLIIALSYWHDMWDFHMSNPTDDPEHKSMSRSYIDKWYADGQKIVDAMNAAQTEIQFTFVHFPI